MGMFDDLTPGSTVGAGMFDDLPAPKPAGAFRKLADLGLSVGKGVIAVPELVVGLGNLVSGGRVGKAVEDAGVRFKDAKEVLSGFQSDDLKAKQKQFQDADGLVDKFGVAVSNPSLIANAVAESVPSIGAGGVAARGVKALGASPLVAGAVGEGIAGAGTAAESIRQETADGYLTAKQALMGGATGLTTAGFGALGAKAAKSLGIGDVDTMLAKGTLEAGEAVAGAVAKPPKGMFRRAAEGAFSEGVLEELPQSVSEQALQNIALDRPVTEGMADAAVMGTLAGNVMGAGAGVLGGNPTARVTPPPAPAPAPAPLPVAPTPSQAMGIDPAAGIVSRTAAAAVDGGATVEKLAEQAEQSAQAAAQNTTGTSAKTGQAATENIAKSGPQNLTPQNVDPATGEIRSAYDTRQQDRPTAQPGDLMRNDGKPFNTIAAAKQAAGKAGPDFGVIRLDRLKFVVRKREGVTNGTESGVPGIPAIATGSGSNQPAPGLDTGVGTGAAVDAGSVADQPAGDSVSSGIARDDALNVQNTPTASTAEAETPPVEAAKNRETVKPGTPAAGITTGNGGVEAAGVTPEQEKKAKRLKDAIAVKNQPQVQSTSADVATNTVASDAPVYQPTKGSSSEPQTNKTEPVSPQQQGQPAAKGSAPAVTAQPAVEPEAAKPVRAGLAKMQAAKAKRDIAAKQIPDLTDAELLELKDYYPADNKRAPKIAKEIEKRGLNKAPAQSIQAQAATESVAVYEQPDPAVQRAEFAKKEKTRQDRAARLRNYTYVKSPFLAFLGKHGVALSRKADFSPDKNPLLSGYGPLFRRMGKNTDLLVQNAIEEHFLPEGADSTALDDLITQQIGGMGVGQTKRIEAVYSPDVADRVMNERMDAAQDAYQEELASQQEAAQNDGADPFAPMTALEYNEDDASSSGYNDATQAVQLEVNALLLTAEKLGIDTDELKQQANDETRSGTQQDYLEAARAALKAAIEGSNGNSRQDAGQPSPARGEEGLVAPNPYQGSDTTEGKNFTAAGQTFQQVKSNFEKIKAADQTQAQKAAYLGAKSHFTALDYDSNSKKSIADWTAKQDELNQALQSAIAGGLSAPSRQDILDQQDRKAETWFDGVEERSATPYKGNDERMAGKYLVKGRKESVGGIDMLDRLMDKEQLDALIKSESQPRTLDLESPTPQSLQEREDRRIAAIHEEDKQQKALDKKEKADREAAEMGEATREADKKAKASAARAKPATEGLSIGFMPNSAEPITVKNGVVYVGKYPAQNFETADDITVPEGATDEQVVQALRDAGAIAKRQRVFGLVKSEVNSVPPAPQEEINLEDQIADLDYEANKFFKNGTEHLGRDFPSEYSALQTASNDGMAQKDYAEKLTALMADHATARNAYFAPTRKVSDEHAAMLANLKYEPLSKQEESYYSNRDQAISDLSDENLKQLGQILGLKQSKKQSRAAFVERITEQAGTDVRDAYLKVSKPDTNGLTAPTKADILDQQDRKTNADKLDDKEQIGREASGQTLTSQTAPEQRTDTSGDMFGEESDAAKRSELENLRAMFEAANKDFADATPAIHRSEAARIEKAAATMDKNPDIKRRYKALADMHRATADRKESGQGGMFDAPAPEPKLRNAGSARLEDSGQVLEGARKLYAKAYAAKLDEGMAMNTVAVPLSKSWPEPDYQRMLDDGADPWAVAFAHAARDEVPNKPVAAWKVSGWAKKVERLRQFAADVIAGKYSKADIEGKAGIATALGPWLNKVDLYEAAGHGNSLKDATFRQSDYGMYGGQEFNPAKKLWVINKANTSNSAIWSNGNWGNDLAVADTKAEAIEQFKTWLATQVDKPAAAKTTTFDIYSYRSKPGVFIVGKRINAQKSIDLKTFATVKEARQYKTENQAELEALLAQAKFEPPERRETNAPRVGIDHRDNADVTTEQFRDTFGFRGEQFGASMPQGERQANLNQAYDALMDLAGVIGVSPKALSLNGELGLAFGARGVGGKNPAAAHYEADTTGQVTPNRVVINLTRKNGAGSLAHEWFHAVDNYFARAQGQQAGFMTERVIADNGVRPEMREAFRELTKAINQTGIRERSKTLDAKRTKDYWSTGLEMAARSFESYVIAKLQDQNASNDYLANIVNEVFYAMQGAYPYPAMGEMPAIRAAFDHFFDTVQTKETDKGVAMFSRTSPIFRSALRDGLDGINAKALTGNMWADGIKGLINKGTAKADEVEWSGVTDWLKLQENKVTKEQVLDYLDGNGVRIEETVLGASNPGHLTASKIGPENWDVVDADDNVIESGFLARQSANEFIEQQSTGNTEYGQYQLPGGENYRELLLTLPEKSDTPLYDALSKKYGKTGSSLKQVATAEELAAVAKESAGMKVAGQSGYKSSHWDQKNILAHIRFNERTDADGKRVLFVEELQSDFGQDFKKQKTAINKAVDDDFEGIIKRMEKAGVLEVNCD